MYFKNCGKKSWEKLHSNFSRLSGYFFRSSLVNSKVNKVYHKFSSSLIFILSFLLTRKTGKEKVNYSQGATYWNGLRQVGSLKTQYVQIASCEQMKTYDNTGRLKVYNFFPAKKYTYTVPQYWQITKTTKKDISILKHSKTWYNNFLSKVLSPLKINWERLKPNPSTSKPLMNKMLCQIWSFSLSSIIILLLDMWQLSRNKEPEISGKETVLFLHNRRLIFVSVYVAFLSV